MIQSAQMRPRQITLDYSERTDPQIPFLLSKRAPRPHARPPIIVDRARLVVLMARKPFTRASSGVPRLDEIISFYERRARTRTRIRGTMIFAALVAVTLALFGAHRAGYHMRMPSWSTVLGDLARMGPTPSGAEVNCNTSRRDP